VFNQQSASKVVNDNCAMLASKLKLIAMASLYFINGEYPLLSALSHIQLYNGV
jgi:hypothetical protein